MNHVLCTGLAALLLSIPLISATHAEGKNYKNFDVAVYARVYEVQKMNDPQWLEQNWNLISKQVKVDKFYIETHRDRVVADDETIEKAKQFFASKGIKTAGGIALVANEPKRFAGFCYTDPKDREFVKHVVEHTAKHFDEIILDDFFFNSTKTDSDIKAKGNRSWTQFRLDLMHEVAQDLVIKPARAVNPKVKIIIKYPNWYEHFQGLGFDLDAGPKMFDGIYTGTETRQPVYNAQHLQQYESYGIIRYFDNIAPGRNGGGWVDTGGMQYADRYAEQLWLTMFAKAPEITLFAFHELLRPLRAEHRGAWQDQHPSLDFDALVSNAQKQPDGTYGADVTLARIAGAALEQVDPVVGKLGNPIGIPTYRPPHATGEDFLHNYLGMIGIPMDIHPDFPANGDTIFLTESAKFDPQIVEKIKQHLTAGKSVVITSGLLRALQGKGIEEIAEIKYTGQKTLTSEFYLRGKVYHTDAPILLPQIEYLTNDAWEMIGSNANGYPLVVQADYSKGELNVLTIPDNFADMYRLPVEIQNAIKNILMDKFWVRLEGPSQISLFAYDNNTFVAESFRPEAAQTQAVLDNHVTRLRDLVSGEELTGHSRGDKMVFDLPLKPHSYRAFATE